MGFMKTCHGRKFPPLLVEGEWLVARKSKRRSQSSEDNMLEAMEDFANTLGSQLKDA